MTSTLTKMISEQTVNLTGITAGGGETQVLSRLQQSVTTQV